MKCKIRHAQDSDIGQIRENNEDNNIELEFEDMPQFLALGAIDGVGGYAGGEVAAKHCKETVENFLAEHHADLTKQPLQLTLAAMQKANNFIYEERKKDENLSRMSCVATMALLDCEHERLYFAHVGDSRGYMLRDRELVKFTEDHSMVGYLEEIGELTEAEAMAHPRRNEVSKLMGEKLLKPESTYIQSGEYSFYSGDIVLFCSDGLTDLVNSTEIIGVLQKEMSLEEKKNALIALANAKGGKDNITVALATYGKVNSLATKKIEQNATQILVEKEEVKSEETTQSNEEEVIAVGIEQVNPIAKNRSYVKWLFLLIFLSVVVLGFLYFDDFREALSNLLEEDTVTIDSIKQENADSLLLRENSNDTVQLKDNVTMSTTSEAITTDPESVTTSTTTISSDTMSTDTTNIISTTIEL